MVSRDSSFTFKKAIDEANRSIIQISDRFHVIQNLRKATEWVLKRLLPDALSWLNDFPTVEVDTRLKVKKQRQMHEKKKQLMEQVKQLRQQQMSFQKIAKLLHLDQRTVKKYSQVEQPPHAGRGYRPSLIDPFVEELQTLVRAGHTNKEIDARLRKLGFTGKYSTVRIRIEDYRRLLRMGIDVHSLPSKKTYSKLKALFFQKDPASIGTEDKELLKELFSKIPQLAFLYDFYHHFLTCFSNRQIQDLKKVMIQGLNCPIEEVKNYCKRLYQDRQAIENSLRYSFSNGLLYKFYLIIRHMNTGYSF
jgi:transposase